MQQVTINRYLFNALIVLLVVSLYANVRLVMRDIVGLPLMDAHTSPIAPQTTKTSEPQGKDATEHTTFATFQFPTEAVPLLQSAQGDSAFDVPGDDLKEVQGMVKDDTLFVRIEGYDDLNPELGYEVYLKGDRSFQLRVHPQRKFLFVEQLGDTHGIRDVPLPADMRIFADEKSVYAHIPLEGLALGSQARMSVAVFDPRSMIFDRNQFSDTMIVLEDS